VLFTVVGVLDFKKNRQFKDMTVYITLMAVAIAMGVFSLNSSN